MDGMAELMYYFWTIVRTPYQFTKPWKHVLERLYESYD